MSNFVELKFMLLIDVVGKNYLFWILDASIHLNANGLGGTIKEMNQISNKNKPKVIKKMSPP